MEVSLVATGFLLHIFLEFTGMNKTYALYRANLSWVIFQSPLRGSVYLRETKNHGSLEGDIEKYFKYRVAHNNIALRIYSKQSLNGLKFNWNFNISFI
jgi:hypothetical protein